MSCNLVGRNVASPAYAGDVPYSSSISCGGGVFHIIVVVVICTSFLVKSWSQKWNSKWCRVLNKNISTCWTVWLCSVGVVLIAGLIPGHAHCFLQGSASFRPLKSRWMRPAAILSQTSPSPDDGRRFGYESMANKGLIYAKLSKIYTKLRKLTANFLRCQVTGPLYGMFTFTTLKQNG